MTVRKNAPYAKRRWLGLGIAAAAATLLVAGVTLALIIGNLTLAQLGGFGIDGNMHKDASPEVYDWQNAGGDPAGPNACSALAHPGFAGPLGPLNLFCANDKPTGTTDNSLSGHENDASVQAVCGSIPNNKSDLTNFYVASQSVAGSNFGDTKPHSMLYLGWTRVTSGGSADMDFEFNQALQDPNLALTTCPGGNGTTIVPVRTKGDLLVEYQFGGNTIAIVVSHWITDNLTEACATSGSAPCWGTETNLTAANEANGAINDSTTVDAFSCLSPNGKTVAGCITNELSGGTLQPDTFGEAGLDLTAALSGSGCTTFGSAYLKSRSSAVLTDAVKDYIAPVPVNITNCVTPTLTTQLTPASATLGATVTDTATLSGFLGSNPPGGTVTFNVYSGTGANACTGSPTRTVAGSALAASGSNATSTATITPVLGVNLPVGHYEVQAVYSGDSGANLGSSSLCGSEPLQINKIQPTATTQDSPTTSLTIGSQGAISDVLTFGNTLNGTPPTGSVTFTLYTDGACTTPATYGSGDTGAAGTSVTKTVSSFSTVANVTTATTGSLNWTPGALGTYTWGVSYTGDGNYLKIPATGTVQCGGTGETLIVGKATPAVATQIHLDDKATISGGFSPGGTVTFKLYDNADCTGNLVATFVNVAISGGTASTVGVAPTTGGTFVNSGLTYSWQVTYNGDTNNNAVTIGCTVASHETAAISYAP
ncbi:MAG: hypothetical protein M3P18_00540 [Actinomycetota bacterium]|nr:hypothetical protein [Actinomycetota bacterium]